MADDRYLGTCVLCGRPAFLTSGRTRPLSDYCPDCLEARLDECNFGRCYLCRDGDHDQCIGVPCQCPCPPPDQLKREQEREAVLAKLTPAERQILGF